MPTLDTEASAPFTTEQKPDCPVFALSTPTPTPTPTPTQNQTQTLRPLRPYQTQAIKELDARFASGSAGELLVLPTGMGKTLVAAEWTKPKFHREDTILFLCNRNKLISQMREELEQHGLFPLVERAEERALGQFKTLAIMPDGTMKKRTVVIASVQTLHTERLQQWPRDSFNWIISDEAHGAAGEQWKQITRHFHCAQHLGLSATPERSDGKSLDDLFKFPYVKPITLREGVEKGFLSPFIIDQVELDIDLRKVGIVGKDFDQRELDKLIWQNTNTIAEEIYLHGHKKLKDGSLKFRPTIVFTPHVNSADAVAAALRDKGIKAACISYRSPDPDILYRQFKSGELECLVNVAILQEGFNAPWVEMVALACPGLSIGPVTQKVGRGTRLSPQTGKSDCKILEFRGTSNSSKDLVGALDIILGDTALPHNTGEDAKTPKAKLKAQKEMAQKMKDRAQQLLDSGEAYDPLQAVDLARELLEEENKAERERKLEAGRAKYAQKSNHRAKLKRVNPFGQISPNAQVGSLSVPVVPRGGRAVDRSHPNSARPEQLRALQELSGGQLGHASHGITAAQAGHQIALLETRHRLGLSSPAQIASLIRYGVNPERANNMTSKQAGAIIGSMKNQGR